MTRRGAGSVLRACRPAAGGRTRRQLYAFVCVCERARLRREATPANSCSLCRPSFSAGLGKSSREGATTPTFAHTQSSSHPVVHSSHHARILLYTDTMTISIASWISLSPSLCEVHTCRHIVIHTIPVIFALSRTYGDNLHL